MTLQLVTLVYAEEYKVLVDVDHLGRHPSDDSSFEEQAVALAERARSDWHMTATLAQISAKIEPSPTGLIARQIATDPLLPALTDALTNLSTSESLPSPQQLASAFHILYSYIHAVHPASSPNTYIRDSAGAYLPPKHALVHSLLLALHPDQHGESLTDLISYLRNLSA